MSTIWIPIEPRATLGFCLEPRYGYRDMFEVKELILQRDWKLKWFHHLVDSKPETFNDYYNGVQFVAQKNKNFVSSLDLLDLDQNEITSLQLKVNKELTSKQRIVEEEQLMLQEAIKRNHSKPRLDKSLLKVEHEVFRQPLFKILQETPYISLVSIPRHNRTLLREGEHDWTYGTKSNQKMKQLFHRASIAEGFELRADAHWGKTKSTIRDLLLPRANQLLQHASVKKILDEALRSGQKVLVSGNFIFWYEGKDLGWIVKVANESATYKKGHTLWDKGTILSTNHGRIVVLPFIKENGERVKGHTKNAPHDGAALPRHKDDWVELPFEVLHGDLMQGLFGELYYE